MNAKSRADDLGTHAKNQGKQAGRKAKNTADRGANKADDSRTLDVLARVGFVVLGVLHLIIGWFAVRIATGDSEGEEASNSGALSEIAEAPGGQFLLWFAVAGLAGLAIWRLIGIFIEDEAKDKAKSLVLAVVYSSLAFTTSTFARGSSTSDGDTATDVTAKVMEQPMGVALVIAAGVVVLGVGLYSIWNGVTKGFKDDLEAGAESGHVGSAIVVAGVVGYVARGIAFGILGVLIVMAAWTNDPEKAAGLDSALRTLGQQPAGSAMLIVIGVGVALYGVYSIARARYASR
ncbi:DUF1206 domain-containing protein [uncultured Corynebacterium sp.]|uniref:DUF1206 domain-containing protein n=1 Tax=uncultured Corynebacterium sp. TaxID=159447 RepID=UPI0025E53C4A|nr:DUF1206 domain-containing protein [uncultured Corynebacterium sp.]